MQKLIVAPFELHERLLKLIRREADNARCGLPARIIARINSLSDPTVIEALYLASQAGVRIDLIVRGICSLKPGVPGISENITVRSIVDRFLEHCRIYYFENSCQPEVFLASADWLPRNLFRRIELAFPIDDGNLRERLIREVLALTLADNVKARFLQPDGTYSKVKADGGIRPRRSQFEFITLASPEAADRGLAGRSKRRITVKLAKSPFTKKAAGRK